MLEFVVFSSPSFMNRTNICLDSIKKYHPESPIHLEMTENTNGTYVEGLAKRRIEKLLELIKEDNNRILVLLGADCILYDRIDCLENLIVDKSMLLTPHVLNPPSQYADQIYKTGHANADILVINGWKSIPVLEWLIKQDMIYAPERGIFYEQTWLSSLPFIFNNIGIIRHPGFNFAYFNMHERKLIKQDAHYTVEFNGLTWPLKIVQFSGYEKGLLDKFSKHYRNSVDNQDLLTLIKDYDKLII